MVSIKTKLIMRILAVTGQKELILGFTMQVAGKCEKTLATNEIESVFVTAMVG
jgi:hypothetical protein